MTTRRAFLKGASLTAGAAAVVAASHGKLSKSAETSRLNTGQGAFLHGIASGDPYSDSVVIWTRYTPTVDQSVPVHYEVARDIDFNEIVQRGVFLTDADRDYTVKLVAEGLQPATSYFYRFFAHGVMSEIGRTRTAPVLDEVNRLRFALVSCAAIDWGYFNAYAALAKRRDLDAVLCLGDYIYEYEEDNYGDPRVQGQRDMQPDVEITTLDHYRTRHANYKSQPELQAAHQQFPFICIWDDHESTNDSWKDGAENHNEGEGEWAQRKAWSIQAYFEWMPVRDEFNPNTPGAQPLYRYFNYGNLVDLFMLDTRLEGRDEQPADAAEAQAPNRGMMSPTQEAWLFSGLANSTAKWKLVGQQTMLASLNLIGVPLGIIDQDFNLDQWDGYKWQQQRIFDLLAGNDLADGTTHPTGAAIQNVVILTGDIHTGFGMDVAPEPLTNYQAAGNPLLPPTGSLAVEFVTPSITSMGFPPATTTPLQTQNPHMRYVNEGIQSHGYCLLDITAQRTQGEWYYGTTDVTQQNDQEMLGSLFEPLQHPVWMVEDGVPYLVRGTQSEGHTREG